MIPPCLRQKNANAGLWGAESGVGIFPHPIARPISGTRFSLPTIFADTCRRTNRGGRKDAQDSGRGWTPYAHVLR